MKNPYMIRNIGPHLLTDYSAKASYPIWNLLWQNKGIWIGALAVLFCICLGMAHAQTPQSDPMVMKVYPDGTKVLIPWSEVGKSFDEGKNFGGAPKILPYDPSKDGIVPIGQTSKQNQSTATNPALPASTSVVTPEQPAKMDYSQSNPDNYDNFGPKEGFGFRTDVGVSFQQSLSGRDSGDSFKTTFQPGVRFDIEPFYNVTDWFSVGVEAAFIHNTVQSISINGDTSYRGNPDLGNGDLYQVPILLNTRFQFPTDGPIRGFFGAGMGGNWNFANVATRHDDSSVPYDATSYQWNYAFELSAGLCYTIAPGLDLNTSFKTLCTPNPLGEAQNGPSKASYNYACEIGLAWRF